MHHQARRYILSLPKVPKRDFRRHFRGANPQGIHRSLLAMIQSIRALHGRTALQGLAAGSIINPTHCLARFSCQHL